MANPRKFSDKIALHTQKQAEETAAFEAIIKEVSATTKKPVTHQVQGQQQPKQQVQQQHLQLIQPNFGAYRGHSLPNVNQVANNSIDLQGALSGLADIRQAVSGHSLPDKHRDRGQQSQKKFSHDRHRDCSPYGSVSYLSPPPDTSWRRASSDSALHATVQQGGTTNFGVGVLTNRQAEGNLLQVGNVQGMEGIQMWDSKGLRPRSCDVPGISIYPSPDPSSSNAASILISSNTGSLPDLANLNFPSPLTAPLDSDISLTQPCSSQDSGILDSCVPPINITLQLYQQLADQQQQQQQHQQPQVQAQGLPMAPAGLQRHMVPAPLILQGSNGFIMGGGSAVLTQDNTYHRPLNPDKPFPDCRSPPAYSSLHPPNSCPLSPPLITLTDVTQGGGAADKILFSEFELADGCYETNGWCGMLGQSDFQAQRHPAEYPHGCAQRFTETGADSFSTKVPRHRNAPQNPPSPERNSFYPSSGNSKRMAAVSDAEMRNGALMRNCENAEMDAGETRGDQRLGMAPYRGAPSDGPQSPNSPMSQPSSSYSPSQSPGTSASMASSPQMPDSGYQQDVIMAQVPYAFSQQQLGQSSGTASQQAQTQQQMQQLARLVGKTALPSDSLQHKFQQIKVEDSANAANELNLRTAVQQHLQQQQLQHELQQLQQQQQQQQLQQQQHAAAAAALMSSGNLVFMRTAPDQPPVVVGSIAPTGFYQPLSTQQAVAPSQSQQQLIRQLQGPYVAGSQGLVASTGNPPQSVQFPLPPSSSAIPDIVLTAADLSLYANQAMMDFKNTGDEPILRSPSSLSHSDSLSRDAANLLSYLGESFDADMLTSDDFLKIGLDPLELEEIRMLSDANIVADPATEDSFRLDRM